jgi:hypothetical protein
MVNHVTENSNYMNMEINAYLNFNSSVYISTILIGLILFRSRSNIIFHLLYSVQNKDEENKNYILPSSVKKLFQIMGKLLEHFSVL